MSEKLTCLNCHHPHHSVESTPKDQYNNACRGCHQTEKQTLCPTAEAKSIAQADCVSCHMPRSGSIDIPHVNITDHYITTPQVKEAEALEAKEQAEVVQFLGLQMLTKENPTALDMARGYIALFDKYVESTEILDSAAYHLYQVKDENLLYWKTKVHYHFAREEFSQILSTLESTDQLVASTGWTAYRIGHAFAQTKDYAQAEHWYRKAVKTFPYDLDFQEKLGIALTYQKKMDEAAQTFEFILSENPKRPLALGNLGFIRATQGGFTQAEQLYDRAIALDPDYVQALLNKAALHVHLRQTSSARALLARVLHLQPGHAQARMLAKKLSE